MTLPLIRVNKTILGQKYKDEQEKMIHNLMMPWTISINVQEQIFHLSFINFNCSISRLPVSKGLRGFEVAQLRIWFFHPSSVITFDWLWRRRSSNNIVLPYNLNRLEQRPLNEFGTLLFDRFFVGFIVIALTAWRRTSAVSIFRTISKIK